MTERVHLKRILHVAKYHYTKVMHSIILPRAAMRQLPHDTIRIAIFASRYDMYHDTFLTTLEP